MSRHLYLVSYDVSNHKRLYRVRKAMKEYEGGGQKSCYECWVTEAEIQRLQSELKSLIDPLEDRIHIFQLDPRMHIELFGRAQQPLTELILLV